MPLKNQGLRGGGGIWSPGALKFLLIGGLIGALRYRHGALEPQLFCLGALEPLPLWEPEK